MNTKDMKYMDEHKYKQMCRTLRQHDVAITISVPLSLVVFIY